MSFIINPYRHAGGGATNGLLTGLESYWKLDEASGTIADSHGSVDSIGTYGTPTYGETGVLGDCIYVDDDGFYFGDNYDFNYNDTLSISMWVKPDGTSSRDLYAILSKLDESGTYQGWEVEVRDSTWKLRFFLRNSSTSRLQMQTVTTLTDGAWNHVVITYSGSGTPSGVNIYINGVSSSLTTEHDTLGTASSSTSATLKLGRRAGSNQGFKGWIDEVGIWSRELSSTDVTNLYNSGSGLAYGDFTS